MKTLFLFFAFTLLLAAAPPKRVDIAAPVTAKAASITLIATERITRIEIISERARPGTWVLIFRERIQVGPDGTAYGSTPLPLIEREAAAVSADVDALLNAFGPLAAKWAAEDAALKPAFSPVSLGPTKPATP
jgi:hypothetical protein